MELLLHQWEDWPELYRNTDKTEATEIVIIDSQINYRGKLDTYQVKLFTFSSEKWCIIEPSRHVRSFDEKICPKELCVWIRSPGHLPPIKWIGRMGAAIA